MTESSDATIVGSTGGGARFRRWVARESIEDYSLRYAPTTFRRWAPIVVASTALGGIAYLADYAIGASVVLTNGMPSALVGILLAAVVIFVTGIPIAYYSAKYAVDMDLLTRGAGFGYLGSTMTSLIYASFTFIFFALEGSIMAQAFQLGLGIPLPVGYLITSLVVIPIVIYGMKALAKLQAWTQPIWLLIFVAPLVALGVQQPDAYAKFLAFAGPSGGGTHLLGVGLAAGVALSLIAQIGEQVDYLRFMPPLTRQNRVRWWTAVLTAGPGWVILGAIKQLAGGLLAVWIVDQVGQAAAVEPIQQFVHGLGLVLPTWAVLPVAVFFVVLSQVKINVTNAYSGSLSWSNFFSRVLHAHPGRVVWIFLNVGIALALMELGVFGFLNAVLGFYSNVAIAWIGAVVADLVINKPILKLSPSYIEFKRAHLHRVNPVGFCSMVIASAVSILAFFGVFGQLLAAFSPFLALAVAFLLSPVFCLATGGRYYLARTDLLRPPLRDEKGALATEMLSCGACRTEYERPDMASCPYHAGGLVCSLCCSLETACGDACRKPVGAVDLPMPARAGNTPETWR
jgi:purine-cytosine permease-like protein